MKVSKTEERRSGRLCCFHDLTNLMLDGSKAHRVWYSFLGVLFA